MRILFGLLITVCLLFADGGLFWVDVSGSSTGQTAVIKYDRGLEELMLATEFNAGAGNLAWLVPLPSEPEVDSVSDQVFQVLKRYAAPDIEETLSPFPVLRSTGRSPGAAPPVTELSHGFIRNYSYQVLRAFGAKTLENYLTGHGYRLPSGTRDTFRHYLNQGWRYYFVARVDSTRAAGSGQELGIKLAFATDSIVYPLYISRISSRAGSVPVKLYVLADHRKAFPGARLQFSGKVDGSTFPELTGFVDRTCRLTKLTRWFEPEAMEDICLRDAPNDKDFPPEPNRIFPTDIVVNPATGKAYALDDKGNMAVIKTVDGDSFWATTIPLGIFPLGAAVNPGTNRVYIGASSGSVVEIDGANDRPIPPPISTGRFPWNATVNPVTNRVYVASYAANKVGGSVVSDLMIIDAGTRIVRRMPLGGPGPAGEIAVDTVRNRVFVPIQSSNLVIVMCGDGSQARRLEIGSGDVGPFSVAVDQATGKAYVTRYDNQVTVLRPDGTHRELAVGKGGGGVAVNSSTHRAHVANYGNSVTVISGETVLGTVPVGPFPTAVAVNSVTNRVYVANNSSSSVTIINGQDLTTTDIATGEGPYALAVDEKANRVFVANNREGTVTVLDGTGSRSWEVKLYADTMHK